MPLLRYSLISSIKMFFFLCFTLHASIVSLDAQQSRSFQPDDLFNLRAIAEFSLTETDALLVPYQTGPRIMIGPNIMVSRDGDFPHVELMVAADPTNPKNLLGTAITYSGPDGGTTNKTYASTDGGYTWMGSTVPEQLEVGGADPQVAFGPRGTAYFVSLAHSRGLDFYRSEDGGKSWQKPVNLGRGYDHEQIVVDQTTGKYAGRIYVTAETLKIPPENKNDRKSTVKLLRSDDDGRTFLAPVDVAGRQGKGLAAENPLVLSDGTLFIPMMEYPNPAVDLTTPTRAFFFASSSDGGVSFSLMTKIHDQYFGGYAELRKRQLSDQFDWDVDAVYAVDAHSEKYRDRLYIAWNDRRTGSNRILFSYSSDRGKSWSNPRMVSPEAPPEFAQYQPMIAVNDEGSIGIMWFDTRETNREQYNLYFTASVDGGESFLPERRVSSESSTPKGVGNLRPVPNSGASSEKSVTSQFLTGFSRFRHGGDYMGMTIDKRGLFHPFWADARSGTFQIWTSQIRVKVPGASSEAPVAKVKKSVNQQVSLVFDPPRYDASKQEVVLPIRLKNISQQTLYGPFTVEVKNLIHPVYLSPGGPRVTAPQILNSTNGQSGVGAIFDYSSALGDFESLEPGGLTEAVLWKLNIGAPGQNLHFIEAEVTGFVSRK